MLEVPTKPFHRIGPVTPYRTPAFNAVCKVKECMNGKRADRESLLVFLVI
jgi:hypothetical protein